ERTTDLVNCILDVYRKKLKSTKDIPWVGGLHPATKVFQALRIAVNHELDVVEKIIPDAAEVLAPGGRLAIITFHSLEDRIVKHKFKQMCNQGFRLITNKPIVCGEKEYEENARARSAKLRVIEKI
nr:16S rRNA (cytosine(1402)-N(4))-methyltransferase [Candidatus Magasanikbacteria bacterium]